MEILMSVKTLSLILLIVGIGLAFSQIRLSGWVLGWILLSGALLLQGFRSMLSYVAQGGGVDLASYNVAHDWMGLGFSLLIVASMHMMREVFARHRLAVESLRVLGATASDANIVTDDKGVIVVWNPVAQRMFGYSKEEAQGRELDALIVPERDRSEFRKASTRLGGDASESAGGTPAEVAGVRKDGTAIVSEYSVSTVNIDGRWHAIYIFRDITARKQAEAQIRERNAALEMLSAKMLNSDELDRKKLAYGLHEGLAQTLVTIKLEVENKCKAIAAGAAYQGSPTSIVSMLQGVIKDVEAVATALRPSSLDDIGLLQTIRWFCREFDREHPTIRVMEDLCVTEEEVPEPLKIVIYRIIESTFANIVRYESTDHIALALKRKDGTVTVAIDDLSQDSRYAAAAEREADLQTRFGEAQERATLSGGNFRIARGEAGGIALRASWAV